jgi:predicted cupin superfamily sugar epimerase
VMGPAELSADDVKRLLGLEPLSFEGGYYRETHRSALQLPQDALPASYAGSRSASTCIYYLLSPETFSWMHRLRTPEVYHFYLGDPVELLMLHPDGRSEVVVLGHDLVAGQRVQLVVPEGVWQGSRVMPGGRWALMGTTMAPGFELADFELGHEAALAAAWPGQAALIAALSRVR